MSVLVSVDSLKMLRETFCLAQGLVNRAGEIDHGKRLQRLIDECDRQRPLAANGKHGSLHTDVCGCEDR